MNKTRPYFVLGFAVYPALALLAWNIREVDPVTVVRPLAASLALSLVLLLGFRLAMHDWDRPALLTAGIQIPFFSYGQLYQLLADRGMTAYTHRILGGLWALTFIVLAWAILRKLNDPRALIQGLNAAALVLLILPLSGIIYYEISLRSGEASDSSNTARVSVDAPDIYYIILDGFSRADTQATLGYDDGPFLQEMHDLGFYVASCSRSNYRFTTNSITSALNMDFIWNAVPNDGENDTDVIPVIRALQHPRVRRELEARGYRVVAFQTGYAWDEWKDADVYVHSGVNPVLLPNLLPFEAMFVQTTALLPLLDRHLIELGDEGATFFATQYTVHYDLVNHILKVLPEVAALPGPKFVYLHLLIPHPPYVFLPDGSFNPDESYYSKGGVGVTAELEVKGYLNTLAFTESRIIVALKGILGNSARPPVIIVQGDHGSISRPRKFNNLNAYLLPGDAARDLYPTITPVNSFRLVFNEYLGTDYPLLPDDSIETDIGHPYRKTPAAIFPAECP